MVSQKRSSIKYLLPSFFRRPACFSSFSISTKHIKFLSQKHKAERKYLGLRYKDIFSLKKASKPNLPCIVLGRDSWYINNTCIPEETKNQIKDKIHGIQLKKNIMKTILR